MEVLKAIGAECVVNSFLPSFTEDLLAAVKATEATVAFDATGGGPLATDIVTTFDTSLRQPCPDPERVQQRCVVQIIHVPVPPIADEIVEVPQERISECIAEQIVYVPVPPNPEETVEVMRLASQERVQQRTVEQIVDVPVTTHVGAAQAQSTHRVTDLPVVLRR